ncbi:hypothetical protein CF597_04680 [Pseudomonas sp. PSB1]|nr:hypothetical protein [Pseudomonas sp. PSB1]
MGGYQGMRWFKMDFQVQTPEDNRHWADDDLRLQNPRRPLRNGEPDESDIQNKAKRECQIFCVRAGNGLPLGRPSFTTSA